MTALKIVCIHCRHEKHQHTSKANKCLICGRICNAEIGSARIKPQNLFGRA